MGRLDETSRMVLLGMAREIIASRKPNETIRRGDSPFFERWWITRKAEGALENAYIHRFLRSDTEEPHDHPWLNQSIVLAGRYAEEWDHPALGRVRAVRSEGEIVAREAEAVHSIVGVDPGTITLFTTGPKVRDWGFHTDEGWIRSDLFRAWKDARQPAEAVG